jgi:menaquinone-dependent protoporphyrinogen IX oxidase
MKGVVIYDTTYGNTKKIAEAITDALKGSGLKVDISHVKDTKELSGYYDFLILGSPTRIGTMSWAVRGFIGKKIKSEEWANKAFAAFDTEMESVMKKGGRSAAEKISKKLRDKGLKQLQPELKFIVSGMKGPLKDGEIEKAKEYAKKLVSELKGIGK